MAGFSWVFHSSKCFHVSNHRWKNTYPLNLISIPYTMQPTETKLGGVLTMDKNPGAEQSSEDP